LPKTVNWRGSLHLTLPNMRTSGYQPGLHRFSILTAGCTWVLICAGALVTSTESGLSVPDWPLSYGQFFPPMVGGIRFEHTHRLIAAFVSLLMLTQTIWLWQREARASVRVLGLGAMGLILVQAGLGGLTVLMLLPPAVSILHACMAQTFFVLTVCLAFVTSRLWLEAPEHITLDREKPGTKLMALSAATLVVAFGQLLLGAMRRHAMLGLLPHLLGAIVLAIMTLIFLGYIQRYYRDRTELWFGALLCTAILVIELLLGFSSLIARAIDPHELGPAWTTVTITTAHVATGALILGSNALLLLMSIRIRREDQTAFFTRQLVESTARDTTYKEPALT